MAVNKPRLSLVQHIKTATPAFRRWGVLDITPEPITRLTAEVTARLEIYPPGVSDTERVLLRVAGFGHGFYGLVLGGFIVMCTGLAGGVATALLATALLLVTWAFAYIRSHRLRLASKRLAFRARKNHVVPGEQFERVLLELQDLDEAGLDPVVYEAEWGRIYRSMG